MNTYDITNITLYLRRAQCGTVVWTEQIICSQRVRCKSQLLCGRWPLVWEAGAEKGTQNQLGLLALPTPLGILSSLQSQYTIAFFRDLSKAFGCVVQAAYDWIKSYLTNWFYRKVRVVLNKYKQYSKWIEYTEAVFVKNTFWDHFYLHKFCLIMLIFYWLFIFMNIENRNNGFSK